MEGRLAAQTGERWDLVGKKTQQRKPRRNPGRGGATGGAGQGDDSSSWQDRLSTARDGGQCRAKKARPSVPPSAWTESGLTPILRTIRW